jgi:hypothetical protein
MGTHHASARRATRYLPLILAGILAGCGSSGSSDPASSHSVAGVEAAARELLADVAASRYDKACEAFTATARAALDKARGGCPETLLFARPFLARQLGATFRSLLRDPQITGDTVLYRGNVQARYEHNRWHFENDVW